MNRVSMLVTAMAWLPPSSSPARAADQAAFAGQLEALRPAVRSLVAHVLHQPCEHADVEDGTHEAFRRALEGRSRLQQGLPLRPWLLGIARHVALDMLRARRRRGGSDGPDGAGAIADTLADPALGPDARLEQAERARRLRAALEQLDEAQRRALVLFHIEGLGYRQIAERLAVPIGTVGTWVARGRRSLAAVLAEEDTP